ncbi:MAG: glycosyltransferase family 4 protein [Verrucomicrobiota bacterium]
MRIALVYEKFVSEGGLEKYLLGFTRALLAKNLGEVHVVTSLTDAVTEDLPVKIHPVSRPVLPFGWRLLHFDRKARAKLAELQPDVSIGFGRTTVQDFHRAGAGCHRVFSARHLPLLKRIRLKNQVELSLERKIYCGGGTGHFVVNSHLVGSQLQTSYGVNSDNITMIPTAVDSEKFSPARNPADRDEIRKAYMRKPSEQVFLFVSREHKRKGLLTLLKAWKDFYRSEKEVGRRPELWVVGPSLNPRWDAFFRSHCVEVFPSVEDVVPFYQSADWFVHPTRYDACANTVLQSMSCGLPGIISESDGATQFVVEGENGLLLSDPESPEAVADALRKAYQITPEDREAMGVKAREKMLPLTWGAHLDRWMELWEKR